MKLDLFMQYVHKVACNEMNVNCFNALHNVKSRKREYVQVRQIVMIVVYNVIKESTLKDVSKFYKKDHATALHAKKTINNLVFSSSEFKRHYDNVNFYCKSIYKQKYKNKIATKNNKHKTITDLKKVLLGNLDVHSFINANELIEKITST